jgi:predicted RNA-binding protein with PUA-like domain
MGRLSVVPVKPEQWKQIMEMAGRVEKGERGKGGRLG